MYTQKMSKKNMRWGDAFSAVCVILMVYLSGAALEETGWISGLNRVTELVVLGGLIGLAIGQSQFNKKKSIWLVIGYSIVFLSWEIIFTGNGSAEWLDKVFDFFLRVSEALTQLINDQPLQDGVLFFLGMGVLYWSIGLLSGYYLNRHAKPWIPLGVAGLAIVTIQLFQVSDLRNNILSALFAFLFIILIVRLNYWVAHLTWIDQQISEDVDTAAIFGKVGLILAIILVVVAWSTPFLVKVLTPGSEEQITFSERFEGLSLIAENFFAPFRQIAGNQEGYFGHTLTLGNERSLSEKIIFTVTAPTSKFYDGRYYWRARVFDKYLNGFWQETSYEETTVNANQLINNGKKSGLKTGKFLITAKVRLSTIFAFPEIVSLSNNVWVQFFNVVEEMDLLSVSPVEPINSGESYTVTSSFPLLFREDLMTASGEIPSEILERYLQLPLGFSPKIKKLAEEISARMSTKYEKVIAINVYLRKNYEYVDHLKDLPEGDDLVEWFLFDYKKGFCNYFASAEVLLLRAVGIPARLAAGYSQGMRVELDEVFEVREKDSHTWVEVYFSGIGWVAFEPTPSQPILTYVSKSSASSSESNGNQSDRIEPLDSENLGLPINTDREDMEVLVQGGEEVSIIHKVFENLFWILPLTVFLGAFFIIFQIKVLKNKSLPFIIESGFSKRGIEPPYWLTEWARHQQFTPFELQLVHIDWMLKLLHEKTSRADTPKQKINRLINRIPEMKENALAVLTEYEKEIYGRRSGNFEIIQLVIKRLWKATAKEFIEDRIRRIKKALLK